MDAILEAIQPLQDASIRIRLQMKLDGAVRLVDSMVSGLVDKPESVSLCSMVNALTPSIYTVRVTAAAEDIGKIIGKQGRTARSMRTILSGYAKREGLNIALDIVEGG